MVPLSSITPEVIHLASQWLVLSKPSGWLTIPGRVKISDQEIETPVLSQWAELNYGPIWVVHRLDRETSGVILFARSASAHRDASLWFQERKVRKYYYCLAQGAPLAPVFKLNHAIKGAPCMTQIEVKKIFSEGFFARIHPYTGRRHQIRIHLSSSGYPILGDVQYGGAKEILRDGKQVVFARVALHSFRLDLPTGEKFEASIPGDFVKWLSQLNVELSS